MPELPEVETIRRELEKQIIGHTIKRVEVLAEKTIHGPVAAFKKQLVGNQFTALDRRGKLLIFSFKRDGWKLLIHLKMTGQLVYQHGKELTFGGHNISESDLRVPNRFTRVVIRFRPKAGKPRAGGTLYFNDMRRFGFLKLVKDGEVEALVNKSYGLDALDPKFSKQYLTEALKRRGKTSIKAALLDQKHLAGIGNIYADEVCFATGILPSRKVSTLSSAKIGEIYTAIKRVLNLAIKHGGTTFTSKVLAGHYIRSDGGMGNFTERLKVFDRTGQQCLRCLATRDPTKRDKIGLIQKTRVAGRGTHFCPVCQH